MCLRVPSLYLCFGVRLGGSAVKPLLVPTAQRCDGETLKILPFLTAAPWALAIWQDSSDT